MADTGVFQQIAFSIGGIAVSIKADKGERIFFPAERYPLIKFSSNDKAFFAFGVHGCRKGDFPPFAIDRPIFTNGCTWSLYRLKDNRILWLDSELPDVAGDRAAVLDMSQRKGEIYCKVFTGGHDNDYIFDPLTYPFDQIFMIQLLARNIGHLVHACGIDHKGEGILFAGNSGAGKTTMANLWGENVDTKILSDDRIIIRKLGGRFRIYGTPWHGTGKFAKPDSALLKKIFFLKHGDENKMIPLKPSEAISRLLATSFPPFWDKEGIDFILEQSSSLFSSVPAYELTFVPDMKVADLIKSKT